MDLEKYFAQLVGFQITGFAFEHDEYALEPFPVFTVTNGKENLKLTVSMDSEGNGGGFVFIEGAT